MTLDIIHNSCDNDCALGKNLSDLVQREAKVRICAKYAVSELDQISDKNFSHYLKLIFHCFEILDKNCEFVTLRGCLWSERPPRQLVQVQINCRHNSYLLNSSFKENALRIPSDEKRGCVLSFHISFLNQSLCIHFL